ncbi:class I SAM-dependent methyltransferase [Blastococcus saxobsidens]|uniref:Putative methyltransferase n=1 Tax=Blastococcus saxobsidens (strain DD2) TaxID=1146883 RepID=H6RKZ4_BLASD|nr:class I SAM-dependent methyltransferase [Blastococcus saxobsidens]CCG04961.1 putative methyltransferase [Blastococcus saxobsidens DD2]
MLRETYVGGWRLARRAAERTGLLARLDRSENGLARHARSLFAIHDVGDLSQLDLPWWTYPAIADVEAALAASDGKARVFEYGSGASSVWLGRRAGEVHSVEHSGEFVEFLGSALAEVPNVRLRHVAAAQRGPDARVPSQRHGHEGLDFAEYVSSIDVVGGPFDVIVIDGRARAACLRQAIPHLAHDGLVVFDNSNRVRYREAILTSGLAATRYRGWVPSLPYQSETTILRHR